MIVALIEEVVVLIEDVLALNIEGSGTAREDMVLIDKLVVLIDNYWY